jgi:hypothetical protein
MPFGARRAWRLAGGLLVTGGQCPAGLAAWRGRQRLTARVYELKGEIVHARSLPARKIGLTATSKSRNYPISVRPARETSRSTSRGGWEQLCNVSEASGAATSPQVLYRNGSEWKKVL